MYKRSHRTNRQPRFEPQTDVNQNTDECVQHGQAAVFRQLLTDLRADEFHPAQFDIMAGTSQGLNDLVTQLGAARGRLRRHPD